MKLLFLISICLITNTQASEELTLKQFIENFKKHDPRQEFILSQLMQIRYNKELNLPAKQWLLEINTNYNFELNDKPKTFTQNLTITRNNAQTGTDISVGLEKNELVGREEETKSLSLEQSLINNPLGMTYRKRERIQDEVNQQIRLEVEETYEDYLAERINFYLDFQNSFWQKSLARESYLAALKLQKEVGLRRKKNIARQVDMDRIRVQVIQSQNQIREVEKDFHRFYAALSQSLPSLDAKSLLKFPESEIPYIEEEFDFEKEIEQFWEGSRTSKMILSEVNSSRENVLVQKRELLPELKLVLGYNQDDSTRFTSSANREEAVIGFNFNFAFKNSQDKARVAQAKLQEAQSLVKKRQVERETKAELRGLYRQIKIEKIQVEALSERYTVSRRLLQGELKNYQLGRVTLRDLIDAQNILINAQRDLLNVKTSLAKNIVAWKRITDTLF